MPIQLSNSTVNSKSIDDLIDETASLTDSATGFADGVISILRMLRADAGGDGLGTNALGTAAGVDTGDDSGDVPVLGTGGLLAVERIPTAIAGGATNAGKIPKLDATGMLASTMFSATGGPKGIWKFTNRDLNVSDLSNAPTLTDLETGNTPTRQWSIEWARPTGVTSAIVIVTGAGAGSVWSPSSKTDRKGGGGGSGGTVIAAVPTVAASTTIKVGKGGVGLTVNAGRNGSSNLSAAVGGATSFGSLAEAYGGRPPADGRVASGVGTFGNGGRGGSTSELNTNALSVRIHGGDGHDGLSDPFGGGSGGASFWGGGHSGGGGNTDGRFAAPGAGAGATNGTISNGTFTAYREGKRGENGLVFIIGF